MAARPDALMCEISTRAWQTLLRSLRRDFVPIVARTLADPGGERAIASPPTIKCTAFPLINVFWQDLNVRPTSQRQGFCDAWKALKSVFDWGSAPDLAGGAHDAPRGPLVGWGGVLPSHPHPFDAFGVSASAPQTPFPTQPSTPSRAFWIRACG